MLFNDPVTSQAKQTSFHWKCLMLASPFMCFGQYLCILMKATAKVPFAFSSVSPFRTQNLLSSITTFPEFAVLPTVGPKVLLYFIPLLRICLLLFLLDAIYLQQSTRNSIFYFYRNTPHETHSPGDEIFVIQT